jgi:hypothetical protein
VLVTFDGEWILIPNVDVYKSAVRIHTAHPRPPDARLAGVARETDLIVLGTWRVARCTR